MVSRNELDVHRGLFCSGCFSIPSRRLARVCSEGPGSVAVFPHERVMILRRANESQVSVQIWNRTCCPSAFPEHRAKRTNTDARSTHVTSIGSTPRCGAKITLDTGYGRRFGVHDEQLRGQVGGILPRDEVIATCDVILLPKTDTGRCRTVA